MTTTSSRLLAQTSLLALLLVSAAPPLLPAVEPRAERLPGTEPLELAEPLDVVIVSGIDRYCLRELAASVARRAEKWNRDTSSPDAYEASIAPNRERLRTYIGAVDPRVPAAGIEYVATVDRPSLVGESPQFTVHAVRWNVLAGVTAEGLMLVPRGDVLAGAIALPDADWTPEMFAGLVPGESGAVPAVAASLAAAGCQVLIPTLIDRSDRFSGSPYVRYTNQPHREFIYRQAFELGRHIIGYEVQKVHAAVDELERILRRDGAALPIGVLGVGEGGLLAMFAAALDPRLRSVQVSGYFGPRERVWEEPIYRNVWAQLTEFGDAEIASMIAPRRLVIEACAVPEIAGPPTPRDGRSGGAAPGKIEIRTLGLVREEFDRAAAVYYGGDLHLVSSGEGNGPAGSAAAVARFLEALGLTPAAKTEPAQAVPGRLPDPVARQQRQFDELVGFTQLLLRRAAKVRDKLWAAADRSSPEKWEETSRAYRALVYDEMIGRIPEPSLPPRPRSRRLFEEPEYVAYEVVLDLHPDVVAGGILLLPKSIGPDEKRPVVVCQHGLEGTPMDTITRTGQGFNYYSAFAHELARRGFITFAPQNLYRGQDRFRTLQRKSNPLKRSLFSYIIPQHARIVEFLRTLPQVDGERIAFYGLSYGGKTAVRVPPLLPDHYCLSICSADFNEWVVKNASAEDPYSYVFTGEYEIFEWNMGHVANYAELSYLMTPRPFMVERGHFDGVAPDEWVAWEFAKVQRHYDLLGLGPRTEIEFFTGPHKINGVKTYEFLHRHLNWPPPE